jgi:hypothetical protein
MSFLQPWLLAALPLIALPIVIHLINQRRFQTIQWGAMMFLLAAQRMSRGYSRLRQWLIMLFRTLAVAGLVLAVSRPLASGWLGLAAGGKADTTIILLDRSPSMQEQAAGSGESKLGTGRQQLAQILSTLSSSRYVLIDSASREPRELESPKALASLATAGPASAPADLPLMLQAAYDYITTQRTGRTEIWICSDLRANDWSPESSRWNALRDAFLELPQGARLQLLAYSQPSAGNMAVRVTNVRRQIGKQGAELLVSVRLTRSEEAEKREIPLQFEIEGVRSVVNVEMTGRQTELRDHPIPLEATKLRGFGRVSIPADANPADNEFYFVFDEQPPRKTLVVADDPQAGVPLQLVAGISADESVACTADVVSADQLAATEWDKVSLVLWQSPLPSGETAEQLQAFVDRGGQIVFFPPREVNAATEFCGQSWEGWNDEAAAVETWRGDADLLARTQSGAALPVGQLEIHRHCRLKGESTGLAMLSSGAPLLARAQSDRGGVYFWSTTPALQDSTLASNGVVLYAFVQRAVAAGSAVLGRTRWLEAGNAASEAPDQWQQLSGGDEGLSTEADCHAGVYSSGDKLLAVNRPVPEDDERQLADAAVSELFRGLDFTRVDDRAGNASALIQEIWRMFLTVMLLSLVLEALLCVPKVLPGKGAVA